MNSAVPLAISLSDAALATLIAAAVSGVVSLLALWIGGWRQARERRRECYARALAACVEYREFPFVIRRRRSDAAGEERTRISESLREVQKELAFHSAWIELEGSGPTTEAYGKLVAETRRMAGGYMHDAWNERPLTADAEMNVTGVDYASIRPLERAFLNEVASDLAIWRLWRR